MINYLYVTDFEKSSQVDGAKCDAKGNPQHLHSALHLTLQIHTNTNTNLMDNQQQR